VFLLVVPVWPYEPYCGTYGTTAFRTLDGEMTPEFVEAIAQSLSRNDVHHLRIGNGIYLRLLMAMDAAGSLDFGGDVLNAQLDAVADLVETDFGSYAGKQLAGRTYQPPAYLTELYEQDESLVFGEDCTFIRAVAFGEPPPGNEPEPPLLERAPKASP
jgi:hypothetical protein